MLSCIIKACFCRFPSLSRNPFLDSPQASELSLKVASLQRQLEAETQSKQRAEEMSAELQMKISELQNKLEAEATPSGEEKPVSELEKQMMELQNQLETEVQERQTAEERSAALELRVAELEKPSEALLRSQNMCEQVQLQLKPLFYVFRVMFSLPTVIIDLKCVDEDEERSGRGHSAL